MASTTTLQQVVNSVRAYPELNPVLGTSGWSQEPAVTIANDVLQRILAQGMNWKWNRTTVPSFLTVPLQQDYVTRVTDLSWLEQGWRIDINNNCNNNNGAPKPVRGMETVRDLPQISSMGVPYQMSWIPNKRAIMGSWTPNTPYPCGYGAASTPTSPIQQIRDASGNILFIDSNSLQLNLQSPGFGGSVLPVGTPYGTTGDTMPDAGGAATPGTSVLDGTVTWTVADPDGIAVRMNPLPATGGLTWLTFAVYQVKAPIIANLQDTLTPIPDEYVYLFRQGFLALCYQHAGKVKPFADAYAQWEEALMTALRAADREREEATFFPSSSLTGSGPYNSGLPLGPASPYDSFGY